MGMFYMGWEGYSRMIDVPPDAIPIRVTARMWSWSFEYPNGVVTDTLVVPVQMPVKLTAPIDGRESFDVYPGVSYQEGRDPEPGEHHVVQHSGGEIVRHRVCGILRFAPCLYVYTARCTRTQVRSRSGIGACH